MKRYRILLFCAALALSLPPRAVTLDEARASGRVGETLSGYLAARSQDAETLALVARVNRGRAESYQALAQSNGVSRDSVARLAGEKLVARARPGDYVQGINGMWLRKP
ncbi:YdbL family protein [Edwardsiella piscicida]|uniref:YdbL family protein n=1 Tax=Edwardsiella piscicida TaxID=1263550 RepID=UPI001CF3EDEF|nr:YdbL family protein [Edwardsiella piscicida]UCQ59173.1 YdbL family protein [Edwardsiella piscicida]